MAFSFTPGQIAVQGNQTISPAGTVPGAAIAPVTGPPSDSPFLFIRERGQSMSVMACVQIVLVVVAILSVIICGALYSYSVYLKAQINTKKAELVSRETSFPEYPYEDMKKLSNRMALLDKLLQNYLSPRSPLKFLENVVENQVVFDNFQLSRDKAGAYSITFAAITGNYKALIQQLKALNLTEYHKVIPDVKLGNLTDSTTAIKIQVTTPILVQGKLPDEVFFLPAQVASSSENASTTNPTVNVTP